MYIRKYVVNDRETMLNIPSIDRIEALREDSAVKDIFSKKVEQPGVKILRISWNYVDDFMFFDFSAMVLPAGLLDKLKMLQILHTLYDPQGALILFTIIGKLAMQMCWRLGVTWKSKLPQEVLDAWQAWADQIQELNGFGFKRTIMPGSNPEKTLQQLHVFADASQDTYAPVAYMRGENSGNTSVRFIQARSRIKPIKATHTIPRMELLSIELGLSMLKKLAKTFGILSHNQYIWTDSRACHD
jgi:hypothetical protein